MKTDIDGLLKAVLQSEERAGCRALGRARTLGRIRAAGQLHPDPQPQDISQAVDPAAPAGDRKVRGAAVSGWHTWIVGPLIALVSFLRGGRALGRRGRGAQPA
jgi:hypothetical protein